MHRSVEEPAGVQGTFPWASGRVFERRGKRSGMPEGRRWGNGIFSRRGVESQDHTAGRNWETLDAHSIKIRIARSGDVHPNPGPRWSDNWNQTATVKRIRKADCGATRAGWDHTRSGLTPPVKVLQTNIGSLKGNWIELRALLEDEQPDIVLIQETLLRPIQVVKFDGYYVCRRDRKTARGASGEIRGGGIATLITTRREKDILLKP